MEKGSWLWATPIGAKGQPAPAVAWILVYPFDFQVWLPRFGVSANPSGPRLGGGNLSLLPPAICLQVWQPLSEVQLLASAASLHFSPATRASSPAPSSCTAHLRSPKISGRPASKPGTTVHGCLSRPTILLGHPEAYSASLGWRRRWQQHPHHTRASDRVIFWSSWNLYFKCNIYISTQTGLGTLLHLSPPRTTFTSDA